MPLILAKKSYQTPAPILSYYERGTRLLIEAHEIDTTDAPN